MGSRCWKSVEIDKNQYFERLLKFEMGPRCWKSLFFICFQMTPEDGFQMAFPARPVLAGVRFWHHRGRRCRNCWQGHGSGATEAGNAGRGTVLGPAWPQTLAGARSWGYGFAHTQTCRQVLLKHAKQTGGYRKVRGKDKHTHQFVPVYALTGSWALSCNRACS